MATHVIGRAGNTASCAFARQTARAGIPARGQYAGAVQGVSGVGDQGVCRDDAGGGDPAGVKVVAHRANKILEIPVGGW